MPNKPRAGDAAAFLQAAVRENMLSPGGAKELAAQAAASDKPIAELCVSLGRLTAIQADAIDGLVNPASVADGFQVEGLLGHGAIGIVYRALQPSLSRTVALKTIRASRLAGKDGSSGKAAARFRQEAVAIAKLAHPNIVTAYDYGARDDRLFLAMEMVDGVDLESLISTAGRLDESTAWRLAQQVAAALAHAHELGVVHRDIKPANLLLTEAPAGYPLPPGVPLVKVTDFGLARLMGAVGDEHTTRLTLDGATMGTPHYMAPEQVEDADVGFQADIYALGATVFHLISGKPPFAGRTVMKVFAAKMGGEEADLDSLPEDISQAGRELLASMLAYRPADRPASYGALLSQLREVIGGESGTSTTLGTTLSSVVKASAGGRLSMQPTQLVDATRGGSKSPQKAWRWVAAALCVGGLAIAAAVGPAAVPGAGAPPERQYELDATGGGLAPLFNGVDVFGWTGRGASPAPRQSPQAGMLAFGSKPAVRPIADAAAGFAEPSHYAIEFRLDLAGASAVEIAFDRDSTGRELVLLIRPGEAAIATRTGPGGELTLVGEPRPVEPDDYNTATTFRIARDQRHWFAYQASPDTRLIGWARQLADGPAPVSFRAEGETAYAGDIALVQLVPVAADPSGG